MHMRKSHRCGLMLCAAVALVTSPDLASAKGAYHPVIKPTDFQPTVDNPYFPLVPGTTFRFVETSGKDTSQVEVTITHDTKLIMGVTCVVVHDVVSAKGIVKEDTYDWYAQDKQGNVWYFGEDTKEFHTGGKVSTEGSWEAGIGRNQPGIIMPGKPAPGEPYRQEYGPGHAEDMGQVVVVNDSVTVPYGAFGGCVRTKEWSLLEAGSEKKWYAPGIGVVRDASEAGDVEVLVSVTRP